VKNREPLTNESLEQVTGGGVIFDGYGDGGFFATEVVCRACGKPFRAFTDPEIDLAICPDCRSQP
jgi:hypothetical protein